MLLYSNSNQNTSAVLLIYGTKPLRKLPIKGAHWLAKTAAEKKAVAIFYILGAFFAVPAALRARPVPLPIGEIRMIARKPLPVPLPAHDLKSNRDLATSQFSK